MDQEEAENMESTMEGTWDVTVISRNCQTGRPIRTSRSMSTFHRGGTLVETGDTPLLRSIGQGMWRRLDQRHYMAVLRFFQYKPDGALAGTQKVTRNLELSDDGTEFRATATVDVFDADDSLIDTECATEKARLLV